MCSIPRPNGPSTKLTTIRRGRSPPPRALLARYHTDYRGTKLDVEKLKSLLEVEVQNRQAAEALCSSLGEEKDRLLKFQEQCLARITQQLDYKMKYDSLWLEVRLKHENEDAKQKEHEQTVAALQEKLQALKCEQEDRIRYLEKQLSVKEFSVVQLEQEIAQLHDSMDVARQSFDAIQRDERARGNLELEKLKAELGSTVEANQKLQDQMLKQEKSWMIEKSKLESQIQELSSNWHLGVLKQKLMKLRKENEDLKKQQRNSLW